MIWLLLLLLSCLGRTKNLGPKFLSSLWPREYKPGERRHSSVTHFNVPCLGPRKSIDRRLKRLIENYGFAGLGKRNQVGIHKTSYANSSYFFYLKVLLQSSDYFLLLKFTEKLLT